MEQEEHRLLAVTTATGSLYILNSQIMFWSQPFKHNRPLERKDVPQGKLAEWNEPEVGKQLAIVGDDQVRLTSVVSTITNLRDQLNK